MYALIPRHIHYSTILESLDLPDNVLLAVFYFGLSTLSRIYSISSYQTLESRYMCTVKIIPLGVQIMEFVQPVRHGECVATNPGKVCFIPHEDIYDVIVSEVILGSTRVA